MFQGSSDLMAWLTAESELPRTHNQAVDHQRLLGAINTDPPSSLLRVPHIA